MSRTVYGYATDSSRWGGPLSDEKAKALQLADVREEMAAFGPGGYGDQTIAQLTGARDVGLILSGYTFYEWGNDPEAWLNAGYRSLGEFAPLVQRVSIDIEDTAHPVPADWRNVVEILFEVADRLWPHLADRFGGICNYMPGWYMRGHLGLTADDDVTTWNKRRRALHNSYYDDDPDIDWSPFAGYTEDDVALEQFGDTRYIGGFSVDINAIYIPCQAGGLSVDDQGKLARLERIVAGWGTFTDDDGNELGGEDALAYIDSKQRNLYKGLQITQGDLAAHIANGTTAHHEPIAVAEVAKDG